MEHLTGRTQNYAWGSHDLIAALRARPASDEPEAEIWFGAHPAAPSTLPDGATLLSAIEAQPSDRLGSDVAEAFGGRLPFLLKLLAAGQPLSIQAHPTRSQAEAGFAREDAAGIPATDPRRSYKDTWPKPELLVALTPFEALLGFRDIVVTREFLEVLGAKTLASMSEAFTYAELVGWALGTAPDDRELVDRARAELVRGAKNYNGETWWAEADLLVRIDAIYPDDPGLLVAAMLHRIELTPGEAVYLDAGTLHAYIGGLGVEVMANSDNVLRGGLTPKHIDVPSLLDTLRDDTVDVEILTPDDAGTYATPAAEFSLSVVSPGQTPTVSGPAVVLATAGRTSVTNIEDDQTLTIDPTEAVWLAAGDRGVVDTADQAFIARPGT